MKLLIFISLGTQVVNIINFFFFLSPLIYLYILLLNLPFSPCPVGNALYLAAWRPVNVSDSSSATISARYVK